MANPEHVAILDQGVKVWNKWREENVNVQVDLSKADLAGANLEGADLSGANLEETDLSGTKLKDAVQAAHYRPVSSSDDVARCGQSRFRPSRR